MKQSLDQNDREFLEQLHRRGTSTVQQLCDDLHVTATAVRQRLVRLQSAELVERQAVRSGRGRPHHAYRVAEAGRKLLGDNYHDLALILWSAIKQVPDESLRAQLIARIREGLVQRYGQNVDQALPLQDRLQQLQSALAHGGFSVEIAGNDELPVLRETNCPYLDLAEHDADICRLERAVFEEVLSASVTMTSRCLDGQRCCEFQAVDRVAAVD